MSRAPASSSPRATCALASNSRVAGSALRHPRARASSTWRRASVRPVASSHVSRAALAATSRYLARDLGPKNIRVNLVAAGPLETLAKRAIGGADTFNEVWGGRAPLGWDPRDMEPTARAVVALLSDWFPKTTGEIVHVDGGFHAMGL